MPKIQGYYRQQFGVWGPDFGFAPAGWDVVAYPEGGVIIVNKSDGTAVLATYINRVPYSVDIVKTGKIASFTLEYTPGGVAKAIVNGVASAELPAPNVVLPTWIFNSPSPRMPKSSVGDVYIGANWWDVPEYQTQAVATGIGVALSGVAGYVLRPIDPVISALIGAGLGGGAGYGLAYVATTGIPEIPIPTFGATPEEPRAPMRLGKYLITG